ncbi:PAS domain S-box protein [Gudongella sp. DL1XJH-153]|uniref:PAS domain S-box protein n=1 Tax=Gudongella sp. DL1XJH-153 TaxID=3409804 RepID=UPI003BB52B34
MDNNYKETQMLKLNKYAREYIENKDKKVDYQKISRQMKEFSGAEYVMFNIFDENGKDFTLVGFEGNRRNIEKMMDVIGYNIIGKKFKYEEGRNEKFEKSIVTRVESLKELAGNALPSTAMSIIEKVYRIDSILIVRITKDEKTIGNFTLIFSENQNENDDEMLKLFASQVGLFIDKISFEQKSLESIGRFQSLLKNSVSIITIVDNKGNYVDASDSAAELLGIDKEELLGKNFKEVVTDKNEEFMNTLATISKTKKPVYKEESYHIDNEEIIYESRVFPIEEKDDEVVLFGSIANDITDRKKAEQDLIHFNNLIKYILEHNPSGVAVHDKDLNYIYVSEKYLKSYNVREEDIIGKHHYEIFPDLPQKWRDVHKRSLKGEVVREEEDPYYRVDGSIDWTRWESRPWYDKDGEIGGIVIYTDIITQQKEMEAEIYREREQFKTTLLSVGDAIISTDKDGRISLMNNVAEKLTGWSQEEAYNEPLEKVLNIINENTREYCENPAKKALALRKTVEMENHTILIAKDGKEIPIEDSAALIKDRTGTITGVVIVFRDFTEKKEKQKEIEYLNLHDHLTGIYNRRYFEEELERLDVDSNLPLSVIVIDVNGLILINDAFGHNKGDEILIKSAQAIKNSLKADEIVSRVGGDEFSIILPKCGKNKVSKIIEKIKESIDKESEEGIPFSLAIGFDTKVESKESMSEVLKKAESRMYTNKIFSEQSKRREVILTMLSTLHEKHPREEEHSRRVSELSYELGKAIGLKDDRLNLLKTAGLLHDIGKIAIDYSIIEKPGALTEEEYLEVKKHPEIGYRILKSSIEYEDIAKTVLYHHEKIDGSGYPKGIKEREIPLESKIISIVDAYDAMISSRPYKIRQKTKEEAIRELERCSNTQFDLDLVKVFIEKVIK